MFYELLIIFFVTAYFYNIHYKKNKNDIILNKEDLNNENTNLHEIHITVDHENNYVKLISFVNEYEKKHKKKIKIVHAVSNVSNNQYMISHFINATAINAINKANEISNEMKKFGIIVLRVKVEMRSIINMPQDKIQYYKIQNYLHNLFKELSSKCYFEFHLKLKMINNKKLFNIDEMEDDVKKIKNVAISYNLCSANMRPLLTIRLYDIGYIEAVNYKNKIVNDMKFVGYEFLEEYCQQEFSIYDNNPEIDNGWLING